MQGADVAEQAVDWIERYLLLYESPPGAREKAGQFFAAHSDYADEFRRRRPGVLLMIGPFPEPEEGQPGAMSIFTSSEAAEEFAIADPFVVNGVVEKWRIRLWLVSGKD
ncbi:MAG: hypothetical protein JO050_07710 [Acidimicrobiia bacterium]|nr:hypothetical protein [Acidimicrobiia bacterium]